MVTSQEELDAVKSNCSPEFGRLVSDAKEKCENAARDTSGLPGAGDDGTSEDDCIMVKALVRVSVWWRYRRNTTVLSLVINLIESAPHVTTTHTGNIKAHIKNRLTCINTLLVRKH